MTLSDWTIYKVKRSGSYWQVQVEYSGATNRFETIRLFNEAVSGNLSSFITINNVVYSYAGFDLPRGTFKKVNLYLIPNLKDYYYFPSFLSWNWSLSLGAWYPSSDNTFTVSGSGTVSNIDPFELASNPFTWSVKSVGALVAGKRYLVVEETGGVSQTLALRFAQTFFLYNQIVFINGVQFMVAIAAIKSAASEFTLAVHERSTLPVAGQSIDTTTLNNIYIDPTNGKNKFQKIFSQYSIPTGSLKIFYDFTSYEDSHVKSISPVSSESYSGQIVGDFSEFSNTINGEGYFRRENYIKIKNSDELFSREFSFLFANTKTDNSPSLVFSNFGGYTNPTSGFALGINSSNKLYFENYQELKPNFITLNTHNARKNIFCVLGDKNSIQFGRYNIDEGAFDILDAGVNPEFIRQSNNWYLGTGQALGEVDNYNLDGYMDYFMYFNKTLGVEQANIIASGFYSEMTGTAPVIRTIPGTITGYTTTLTGVTGFIGNSGVLSGKKETRLTGYAPTGLGVTGRLYITGAYNSYITGDTYSGFYMHANLDDYEIGTTGSAFYSVGAGTNEVSAVAYDPNRDTLLVPKHDNANTSISELDLEGNSIRTISTTFDDVEGMCHMTGYHFAIAEEDEPAMIHYGPIKKTDTSLSSSSPGWNSISLPTWGIPSNRGLEGITFDEKENCFYAVNERYKDTKGVYRINFDGSSGKMFDLSFADDLADLHFDSKTNNFFLVSEQDKKIYQTTTGGSLLYEKSIPMKQPEGITFTSDMKKMYIAGEDQEGGYFRLNENLVNTYEQLRTYTGFFSGDQQFELTFYNEKLFSGYGIQPVTGFSTGMSKYTYTGYTDVYVGSGISGYLYSGYTQTPLTGDPTGYMIENSGNVIIASNKVYDYFYDKISYLLERSPDLMEFIYYPFDTSQALNLGFGKKYNNQAHFEYSPQQRGNAFVLNVDSEKDQVNLFLNGVAQHQGALDVTQNDYYENIYNTLSGDYSLIDSIIVNDSNFQTISRGEDDVIYDNMQASTLRQFTGITNTNQWVDARALGVSGDGVQVFINGQKIYSGSHLDYVVKEGFVSGQNYVTGITGDLSTYPDYSELISTTGEGVYDITGKFLLSNVYYMNGIRQSTSNFLVYPTGVSLIDASEENAITFEGDANLIYNKSISYGD